MRTLTIDCSTCRAYCCKALFFSKLDGFPSDKPANVPCSFLETDDRCRIHTQLKAQGLRGCTSYDCIGAGQRVAQQYASATTQEQYAAYQKMRMLHEMLWYLQDCSLHHKTASILEQTKQLYAQCDAIGALDIQDFLAFDMDQIRNRVNPHLLRAMALVLNKERVAPPQSAINYIGVDFSKRRLASYDFKAALLMAADFSNLTLDNAIFLGADLRDANFSNCDCSQAIFLTQQQVNTTIGNEATRLPAHLVVPDHYHQKK
ncbi:MAG: pentapeptide repeat-containing protein [Erysipelotrichaceae bacterium]